MANTSSRTPRPTEPAGQLRIILRPKSLSAGLLPEYALDRFPATIGRHPVNDVELPFDSVSRYHARLELRQGRPHLVDLRSSNGTFVNGKRVQVAPVLDNDSVAFGSVEFIIVLPVPGEQPTAVGGQRVSVQGLTSVHFVTGEEPPQTVFHTELPEETTHSDLFQG
jgi:predicted component of type VI protein secretion system